MKENVSEYVIVGAMLADGDVVMGIALLARRFVAESFDVTITNVLLPVTEVIVHLAQLQFAFLVHVEKHHMRFPVEQKGD